MSNHRCGGCGRMFNTPHGLGLHFTVQRKKHGKPCGESKTEERPPDTVSDLRLELAAWKDAAIKLAVSLEANVIARRDADGGCCDWSCDLCAPLADNTAQAILRLEQP